MKAVWMGVVATSVLLMAGTAQANLDLAKANGCMNCHMVDKKMVGPGFKDVAAKYKGDAAAEAKLIDKVKKGGTGVWGTIPMPPNPNVTDANLKTIVQWILSGK